MDSTTVILRLYPGICNAQIYLKPRYLNNNISWWCFIIRAVIIIIMFINILIKLKLLLFLTLSANYYGADDNLNQFENHIILSYYHNNPAVLLSRLTAWFLLNLHHQFSGWKMKMYPSDHRLSSSVREMFKTNNGSYVMCKFKPRQLAGNGNPLLPESNH